MSKKTCNHTVVSEDGTAEICNRRIGRIVRCNRCDGVEMADCCNHVADTLRWCRCDPFTGF